VCLVAAACDEGSLGSLFVGQTPHEQYVAALRSAGIHQTALGRDWIAASARAVREAVAIEAPYEEVSYLDPRQASASGYRLSLRRGQHVSAGFVAETDSAYRVFLDLFVIPRGESDPILVRSADSLQHEVDFVARRDGDYIVRIQPELLRGGRYAITVLVGPSLAFPVDGHDTTAIRSWFGASRDAGRREHHGLDIFAPRWTPVVAAARGVVRSTRPNRLGGTVVWLRDELGRSLYYAHLQRRAVERGDLVEPGDTIGFVGNSGNARTTPPHLHFGVYERGYGPSDPYPALYQPPTTTTAFTGDVALIGGLARATRDRTRIRALPGSRESIVTELPLHTAVRVVAGSGGWYRVVLPDGAKGFLAKQLAESADQPLRSERVASAVVLRSEPTPSAASLGEVDPGAELSVLGSYGDFLLVQTPSGRAGWLSMN
jgi:murein DD-endopeptidase MepM/ murein hydrolase activator NlpD